MSKINVIQGQTSLFDIDFTSEVKDILKKNIINRVNGLDLIMNLYKDTCKVITKTYLGNIVVYLKDIVKLYDKKYELVGEYKGFDILPNTEILVANVEYEISNIQKAKLKEIDPEKYLIRKGDNNIYIQQNKGVVYITPEGKVWNTKYKLKINALCEVIENKRYLDRSIVIGDTVKAMYGNENIVGKVSRIYNGGDTLNVIWDDKSTAFYIGCLEKVS